MTLATFFFFQAEEVGDTAVQDLGTWDDRKGQQRRPADLRVAVPQRIPLRGTVAVVTLAVGVETPVPVGLATHTAFPGPQVSLPPRAADLDPLLLSQVA